MLTIPEADGYVFDFGGVMTVGPMAKWPRTLYPYLESLGLSAAAFAAGNEKYRRRWDADEISFAEMYRLVFADSGLPAPTEDQMREIIRLDKFSWVDELRPDTLELMRSLRAAGHRIGILTNMSDDFFRDCYVPTCGAYRELADVEVVSGHVGVAKPDPRIYAITAERMGLEPERLCFFDDSEANVRGAIACGWQAVVYPAAE